MEYLIKAILFFETNVWIYARKNIERAAEYWQLEKSLIEYKQ